LTREWHELASLGAHEHLLAGEFEEESRFFRYWPLGASTFFLEKMEKPSNTARDHEKAQDVHPVFNESHGTLAFKQDQGIEATQYSRKACDSI
jgi:hypothetical protein